MVLAGCLVTRKLEKEFKKLGVKDSKMLTPNRREFLAKEIRKKALAFHITLTHPYEIDARTGAGLNLNKIEAIRAAEIINKLTEKINEPVRVIIDCPSTNRESWKNYVFKHINESKKGNLILACEHKADRDYAACSAASILAKSEREKQVKELKKKIGKDFGSLPYNEEVLVKINDKIKLEKIGFLSKIPLKNIKVFSLNPKTLKISEYKITRFITHKKSQIYNVSLERGKNVKLTLNHPLFVLDKKLNIVSKNLNDLRRGNFIAVAGSINTTFYLDYINIFNYLIPFSNNESPIYLEGKIIDILFKKDFKKIQNISMKEGYIRTNIYSWYRSKKRYLPLHLLPKLIKQKEIKNTRNLYVRAREGRSLPLRLPLSKDLLWFMGIYIAEGSLTRDKVMISATNKYIINKVIKFAKKTGIHYYITKDAVGLNSILLTKLIRSFNLGNNAYQKKLPDFTFSLSPDKIKTLLEGVYDGDGYFQQGNWEIETYSEELAKQIQWSQLILRNFTSFSKRKNRNGKIIRILSKNTNSLSPDNFPLIISSYIKKLREKNKLTINELSQKTGIASAHLYRIENERVERIRKSTLEKINKIFRDSKLRNLLNSDICWLKIKNIQKVGIEKVYDLEVKPEGENIENFLGGQVGIILHNSGYTSDPITIEFLNKYSQEHKKDGIFRESWATFQNHKAKKEQKKLGEF